MRAATVTAAEAQAELDRRWQEERKRITPEAIATYKGRTHLVQLAILRCTTQNLLFMCSRRAGKSEVCCGLLLLTAAAHANTSNLYLGLTGDAAGIVFRKWKRLLRRLNITNTTTDSDQLTIFPNGSRVLFTGTDDTRRVTHLLGDSLASGMAIIDEAQDDPGIMQYTAETMLGPMLHETTVDHPVPGRLVISGSVPDVAVGYFWKLWETQYAAANDNARDEGACPTEAHTEHWSLFAWSRYENPFQTDNDKRKRSYCESFGMAADSPDVRRRFHGERVFSALVLAYRFDARKHTYVPSSVRRFDLGPFHCLFAARNQGCDRAIIGIDQAQRHDRFAIVGWEWNHQLKDRLFQFAEAVTDPGADPQESEWLAVCALLRTDYPDGGMEFIRDAGGSSAPTNDLLKHSHGITVVSAIKGPGSVKARVQRLSDLLATLIAKVIEGSQLADDLLTARWAPKALDKGKWELDKSQRSPDVSDAGSYALDLPSYTQIGGLKPPAPKPTFDEWCEAEQKKSLRLALKGKRAYPEKAVPTYAKLWLPPPK